MTSSSAFLFRPSDLRLGDVVLERGAGLGSWIAARGSRGNFSHAMIWVGDDFIEAMPDGVRSLSFIRVPVVDRSRWKLCRVNEQHAAVALNAAAAARNLAFKEYDLVGALRAVPIPRMGPIPTKLFCSQLVSFAYQQAGLEICPGIRPEAVTPNDLDRSPHLIAHALPLASPTEFSPYPYPVEFLNRTTSYKHSTMAREREISLKLFQIVSDDFKVLNIPNPPGLPGNIAEALVLLPILDRSPAEKIASKLLSAMTELGYFDIMIRHVSSIWFDHSRLFLCRNELNIWREAKRRHHLNSDACLEMDQKMPHPLWAKLRTMYTMNAIALDALDERFRLNDPEVSR